MFQSYQRNTLYLVLFFTLFTFPAWATVHVITNTGFAFSPDLLEIEVGDTIMWQLDNVHNVVEVDEATWNANGTTSNGGFSLSFGGGSVVFDTPGEFFYVCQPHAAGGMKGRVVVNASVETEHFVAFLGAANESPSRFSLGHGIVHATLEGDTLIVGGSFDDMLSPIDISLAGGAHIHMGMAGTNGGIVAPLSLTADIDLLGGTFLEQDNRYVLDETQKTMLRNQGMYVNIHSGFYPGGELRGQIVPEADAHFAANLQGVYQSPAVRSNGFGAVVAQLNGNLLTFSGSFSGLSTPLDTSIAGGIHIHAGLAGSNGPVQIPISATLEADFLSGVFEASDNSYLLTNDQVILLQSRGLYLNLHTMSNPGGELRGQLRGPASTIYRIHLSGMNENPPVMTSAQGMLIAEQTDTSFILSGSFNGLESDADTALAGGAHIHAELAGSNGGVITPVSMTFVNDLTSGFFLPGANSFLIDGQISTLLLFRAMYVNIHTLNNGGGELRGQILPESNDYMYARLTAGQQVNEVPSTGNGQVIAEINEGLVTFSGSVDLMSDVNYDIAGGIHVHQAFAGSNGPVQLPLVLTPVEDDTTSGDLLPFDNIFDVPESILDTMRLRGHYVNVHSDEYGSGEVRGQVLGEAQNYFFAPLSGASENAPVNHPGRGAIALEQSGTQLIASGSFSNLESEFNPNIGGGAHLHLGYAGQNGGVLIPLNVQQGQAGNEGLLTGTDNSFSISEGFLDTLRQRRVYANIHSMDIPSGSVRGNALGLSQMYMTTTLSGTNAVDPIMTTGTGAVKLELDAGRAVVSGSFLNLSSPFDPNIAGGAHIHAGGPGENGGIAQGLNVSPATDLLSGVIRPDSNTFDDIDETFVEELISEMNYVNIHTSGFASGEIRGQLVSERNHFPFASTITSPGSGDLVIVEGDPETPFAATWDMTTDPDENEVVYIWQLSPSPTFDAVVVGINTGSEQQFETTFGVVDDILEGAGVNVGDTITLYHRVLASDGAVQSPSAADSVVLVRGMFSSVTELAEGQFTLDAYPNPVVDRATLRIQSPISGALQVQVINLNGQLVQTIEDELVEGDFRSFELTMNHLPSGLYIIQPIIDGKLLTVEKIMKQ